MLSAYEQNTKMPINYETQLPISRSKVTANQLLKTHHKWQYNTLMYNHICCNLFIYFLLASYKRTQWFLNQQPYPPLNTYKWRRCQLSQSSLAVYTAIYYKQNLGKCIHAYFNLLFPFFSPLLGMIMPITFSRDMDILMCTNQDMNTTKGAKKNFQTFKWKPKNNYRENLSGI